MITPAVRVLCIMVAVALGIWLGVKLHASHGGALESPHVRTSAGEASGPSPTDLGDILGAAPMGHPKIPDRVPEFSLDDPQGRRTSITSFGSRSLIINFWATWCAPCRKEMPLLEALSTEWAGRDVTVVGIAVDHRDAVRDFTRRFRIDYPILIGEQDALDAATAFGVATPVFPFTVFTDRRGEVVALFVGEIHRDQAELILSKVSDLNGNRLKLPDARRAITEGLKALDTRDSG
ncbi:MAG TPA: TlpA disulfide reductase family protein [Steroidobacteraceae bacterium]|jgi:thiol-disulfide isomerase/thioredoxin|nr:TlpA disulfide reductase family protein [Steroidobacteraceae bacterium]